MRRSRRTQDGGMELESLGGSEVRRTKTHASMYSRKERHGKRTEHGGRGYGRAVVGGRATEAFLKTGWKETAAGQKGPGGGNRHVEEGMETESVSGSSSESEVECGDCETCLGFSGEEGRWCGTKSGRDRDGGGGGSDGGVHTLDMVTLRLPTRTGEEGAQRLQQLQMLAQKQSESESEGDVEEEGAEGMETESSGSSSSRKRMRRKHKQASGFDALPAAVVQHIFSYLDHKDLAHGVAGTSKRFRLLSNSDAAWKAAFVRFFGYTPRHPCPVYLNKPLDLAEDSTSEQRMVMQSLYEQYQGNALHLPDQAYRHCFVKCYLAGLSHCYEKQRRARSRDSTPQVSVEGLWEELGDDETRYAYAVRVAESVARQKEAKKQYRKAYVGAYLFGEFMRITEEELESGEEVGVEEASYVGMAVQFCQMSVYKGLALRNMGYLTGSSYAYVEVLNTCKRAKRYLGGWEPTQLRDFRATAYVNLSVVYNEGKLYGTALECIDAGVPLMQELMKEVEVDGEAEVLEFEDRVVERLEEAGEEVPQVHSENSVYAARLMHLLNNRVDVRLKLGEPLRNVVGDLALVGSVGDFYLSLYDWEVGRVPEHLYNAMHDVYLCVLCLGEAETRECVRLLNEEHSGLSGFFHALSREWQDEE